MTLDKTIFYNLTYLSILSVVLPLSVGMVNYRAFNKQLKALFFYIFIAAVTEGINYLMIANHYYNITVYNIFSVMECTLLTYVYYQAFEKPKTKLFIKYFYSFFILSSVYCFGYKSNFNKPDFIISTLESVFFIILAYIFYYELLIELTIDDIYNYHFFWINSAFLFYFSAAFFWFLFNEILAKMDLPHYYFLYSFHLVFNIIANLMLATGLWKVKSK